MTSGDDPPTDTPPQDGDEHTSPPEDAQQPADNQQQGQPSPNSSPPESTGQAPPPPGGANTSPQRKLNVKRVFGAIAVITVLIGGVIGAVVIGLPSAPAIGGCGAGTPNATLVTHQSSGETGAVVAVQVTDLQNSEYVHVTDGNIVQNFTKAGDTATFTGFSSEESLNYTGFNACGNASIGSYTAK